MYTSGTTGLPKGVRLTHSNVLTGAALVSKAHRLGRDDRVLAVLPLYHINAQIVTVMAPLFHGGSLVMPDRFSTSRFWAQASDHRCTWLNVVPTMIAFLLNATPPARDPSAIRFCRSASAPLPPEHQIAFEHRSGIPIIETMGLTEAAGPVFSNALHPGGRRMAAWVGPSATRPGWLKRRPARSEKSRSAVRASCRATTRTRAKPRGH